MKHTIKLTKLQSEKMIQLEQQLQQIQAGQRELVGFILDSHSITPDPNGTWQVNGDTLTVDVFNKSEEIKNKLKKA
jgi:hypothetical protein